MSHELITDDSLLQRKTFSAIVADAGHEVDTACNGREALEKIQANPPDCQLPTCSCWESPTWDC